MGTIANQLLRLEGAALIIKNKLSNLHIKKVSTDGGGEISQSDKLDVCARAIEAIEKMDAPIISLSNESQTISCDDKIMNGDITIPYANVYRTGSTVPDSSTPGNNGDIYLVV